MSLGQRMKTYEKSSDYKIIPRAPIMIRLDGKAFHTLTKKLKLDKPFDELFSYAMTQTALELSSRVQGCMLTYTQSDEITMVIRTDQSHYTSPWFDNRVQKMVSVGASIATAVMNDHINSEPFYWKRMPRGEDKENWKEFAFFDCRVWPMPNMVEVENNIIWRQKDCTKNSISSATYYEVGKVLGRKTAQKKMHKLNQRERQDLLFKVAGINWNDYSTRFKRGVITYREFVNVQTKNGMAQRHVWKDDAAPIFTSDHGRAVLQKILNPVKETDDVS